MLSKEKMERINCLARKSKAEGLNDEEKEEQGVLRKEYLASFRENFKGHLDRIKFIEDIEPDNCKNN